MREEAAQEKLVLFLREVDIFQSLTDHELRTIAGICVRRRFSPGDFFAREGTRGDHLYVIMSGQVRLSSKSEGDHLALRTIREGESVPLASLLEPPLLITTAEAIEPVEALVIDRGTLLRFCDLQPMMGMHIYRAIAGVLAHRYRVTLQQITGQLKATLEYMGMTHT